MNPSDGHSTGYSPTMAAYRIKRDDRWIYVATAAPVSAAEPITTLLHETPQGSGQQGLETAALLAIGDWDGFSFELIGRLIDRPPTETEPWPTWQIGDTFVETRWQAARKGRSPLFAQVEWVPGTTVKKSFQVVSDKWTADDLTNVGHAMRLLDQMVARRGGRPKLKSDPEAHWRTQADKAIALQDSRHTWSEIAGITKEAEGTIRRWARLRRQELKR